MCLLSFFQSLSWYNMRLSTKLFRRQKKKSLFIVLILFLITCVVLQVQEIYSVPYGRGMVILKHKFTNVTVQRQIQTGHGDAISGEKRTLDEKENNTKLTVNKDRKIGNSTLTKHSSGTKESEVKSSDQRKDYDDGSKVVFFLGGGKSGSTTLATYLKHDPNNWNVWDPNGQFMDGGKEFCWSMSSQSKEQFWRHFKTHGSKTAVFALDACPRADERVHYERMLKTFPNSSYLMLVRDPVDRVISHMNDMLDGRNRGIESLLKSQMSGNQLAVRLSMFGKIIRNAYSVLPKHKILIVPTLNMTRHPQQTIDKVMKHIGAKPKNVTLVEANKRKHRNSYQIPSNTTIKWLRDMFYNDWELFKNISGLHIETVYIWK